MKKIKPEVETLRFVHQSQHEEALQHRQTIFNVFALALAGLLAMLGGVVSAKQVGLPVCVFATLIIIVVALLVVRFIASQRSKTEEALGIMRAIETKLRLYEKGAYLPCCEPVLPESFAKPEETGGG